MKRPDFPKQWFDKWEGKFQTMLRNPADLQILNNLTLLHKMGLLKADSPTDYFREMSYTGYWLTDLLKTEGHSEDEIEKVCFALGQRCFMAEDVWDVAAESLNLFRRGELKPGPELAKQVYKQHEGDLLNILKQNC